MKELYPNFLDNEADYAKCEKIWDRLFFDEILEETSLQNSDWRYFRKYGSRYDNGSPFPDQICLNINSPSRKLLVLIIQSSWRHDINEAKKYNEDPNKYQIFSAFIDYFAKGEPEELRSLTISCYLTEGCLKKAKIILKKFVALNSETIHQIEPLIKQYSDICID